MTEKEFNHMILPLAKNIYAYAQQIIANSADAADITQEVMIKLWKKRKELKGIKNPKAWGLKITHNLCLDWIKKQKPIYDNEQVLQNEGYSTDLRQEIETRDMATFVWQIIHTLPEHQKEVMILREIEELELDEIEQITGLSSSNIRVLLSRGRTKVREIVEGLKIRD